MTRVSAVVVHYGALAPTVALLRRIESFVDEIIVVANDGTTCPAGVPANVEWMVAERNLGYGQAFTFGVRGRTADVFVLLNTDIMLSRTSFDRCVEVLLSEPSIGIVAPLLRHEDGSLQSGAARLSRWRRAPLVLTDPGPVPVDCEWVTGAVMIMRREVVERVGMDGSYFLGAEDADLCVRASRAGWRVVCSGDAPAVHHRSQVITGPRWTYYSLRNRVWLARANFGYVAAALAWLNGLVLLPRVLVADAIKRRDFSSFRLGVLALIHAWWRKPSAAEGPLPDEPLAGRAIRW
jgi:GT2 family glycosyltransferase